jgi:hypothetical protein
MSTTTLDDFSFTAPGYNARTLVMQGQEETFKPQERSYRRNLIVVREEVPAGTTVDGYCKSQLGQLAYGMRGFQRIKTGTLTLDGQSFPLIDARGTGPDGVLVSLLLAYVVVGRVALTITASHLAGPRFDAARPEFLAIFESFRVG